MSAFIVSVQHIHVLVSGLIAAKIIREEEADATGALLWQENHRSVNVRYRETAKAEPYKYDPAPLRLNDVGTYKSVQCYAYQSCEHRGWERSKARKLCDRLSMCLAASLVRRMPEYDAAPWGV